MNDQVRQKATRAAEVLVACTEDFFQHAAAETHQILVKVEAAPIEPYENGVGVRCPLTLRCPDQTVVEAEMLVDTVGGGNVYDVTIVADGVEPEHFSLGLPALDDEATGAGPHCQRVHKHILTVLERFSGKRTLQEATRHMKGEMAAS